MSARIRPARADDASVLRATRPGLARRDVDVLLLAEVNHQPRAAALLDPVGRPTEPDTPAIILERLDADAELDADLAPLLDAVLDEARVKGMTRLLIGWDPMDHHGLRLLEQRGFRPTGAMPYFEIGGGEVQYVSGYQDATGSTLDLAINLLAAD